MGYTTDFSGKLKFDKPLTALQVAYIQKFNQTRRMKRDAKKVASMSDPCRLALGLPPGVNGEFFVGGTGMAGQGHDPSILDYNRPPDTQPGLWCQWTVSDDGTEFMWDGGEKFYDYVVWMHYLIDNFFTPWGVKLSGMIVWQGEETGDVGTIVVTGSEVKVHKGVVLNGREPETEDDGTNIHTDDGFNQFVLDAATATVRTWELNGGKKIGKKQQKSLEQAIKAFFEDKRS